MNGLRTSHLCVTRAESTTGQVLHQKKIAVIRQQINRGTYDINRRINVVLDRIIEDLISRDREL